MRWVRSTVAALRRAEGGLTLIELLVAATLGLIVVGGALTVFMGGVRSEPRTAKQVAAIQQARVTMDRITRELRQGLETPTTGISELAIVTYVKAVSCGGAAASTSIPCRVTYSCEAGACTRQVGEPDGSTAGSPVQVAAGLTDTDVFGYRYLPETEEPTYVGVTFDFSAGDEGGTVTLEDGVALRNTAEEEEA